MDENKKPSMASREEIQEFFEEEQRHEEEENREVVRQASKKAGWYNSCDIERLIRSSNREFWDWWGSTTPPNIHETGVNPAGPPSQKGSSSRGRKKRKKRPPKPNDSWMVT